MNVLNIPDEIWYFLMKERLQKEEKCMSLFIGKTERVYSTSDSFQKERVQEILNENHIEYKIRARDDSRRNPVDQAGLGSLGNNRLRVTYSFYVDKKDAEWAVRLIHSQV